MAPFTYHAPATLGEAVELLAGLEGEVRILAGGQSLIPLLTMRLARPAHVVDINRVRELARLEVDDGALWVGALVRHRVLESSPLVAATCPILSAAASLIGDRQIRSRGTIGGSLAHADPAAELAAAVLALDAQIVAVGPAGQRVIPALRFFRGYMTTALTPGEILTEVRVPRLSSDVRWAFEELDFKPAGFAVAACAATMRFEGGVCQEARVVLGAAGPTPFRVTEAETLLIGQVPSDGLIKHAADIAFEVAAPEGDIHAPASYRREMARWCARRALAAATAGR